MKTSAIAFSFLISFSLQAAEKDVVLTPEQVAHLGVEMGGLKSVSSIPLLNAPAKVVIPPTHEALVSAPQAALITQLNVTVGDSVQKGQTLATLNSPELVALQQRYLQSNLVRNLALNVMQRDKKLFDAGVVAQRRFLESSNDYQTKQAEVNGLLQMLKMAGMSSGAIQKLAHSQQLNSQMAIFSPISGIVLEKMATAGERLNALAPIYRIANISELWLEIAIPQEQIHNVHLGDTVSIVNSAATAKITLLGKSVNLTNQSVMARAVINENGATLRAGQSANIQLVQANSAAAFEVPNTAIAQNEGKAFVFVKNAQGFAVTPVTVVGKQAATSMISGAFKGSEQIAVKGAVALKANWLGLGGKE